MNIYCQRIFPLYLGIKVKVIKKIVVKEMQKTDERKNICRLQKPKIIFV